MDAGHMPKQYFRSAMTSDLKEQTMHRYLLAAACAVFALNLSACNRNEGMLPKTDGNHGSQTSNPDAHREDAAPAGQAAPDRR